jgi:hypothetical protein
MSDVSPLPYLDTKPVGAADFFTAINATFRFIERKLGRVGLLRYWQELGEKYYAPVAQRWAAGGLPAVAAHWRAAFAAEPGADVTVEETADQVLIRVQTCPAIAHLRTQQREITPSFCQHCYFVNEAIAAPAGLTVRITGGNGSCEQCFLPRAAAPQPQNLEDIAPAS